MKTFKMLINEIRKTFGYKYDDAEKYAQYLKSLGMKEYQNAFAELTITKEKN